jgi:hypothetical protein
MKRRLIALDVILAGLLGLVVYRFVVVRRNALEREARVLGAKIAPAKYPPLPALAAPQPVTAVDYVDIAQKLLLARDRNPNVIIDPAPPPPKPPMPPLPVAYGMMLVGEPAIILSEKPGAEQKLYHKGEQVGAFRVISFDRSQIVFDWDGEKVVRKPEELVSKSEPPPEAAAPAPAPPPSQQQAAPQPLGPGADIGGGYRACQPNDAMPSGTVVNGMRKLEAATPFGKSCRWEPVK